MFEKFNEYTLWIYGIILTIITYIFKRLFERQTYNAVNAYEHKDFKEDIKEVKEKVSVIYDYIIKNKK